MARPCGQGQALHALHLPEVQQHCVVTAALCWGARTLFYALSFLFAASQIYIFYGTRSNAEFVIHSGFFFDNNSHDRVKIKLGVSKSDRLYAMKAEVLARAGIPTYVRSALAVPVCSGGWVSLA